FGYFDHEPGDEVNLYVGMQGRGVWRITIPVGGVAGGGSISLAPGSPPIPAPRPGCPPCCAFSQSGDILGTPPLFSQVTTVAPMGPPGCGLGWPFVPGNVDAFS